MSQVSFSKITKWLASALMVMSIVFFVGCSKTGTIEVKNDSKEKIEVSAISSGGGIWFDVVNAGGKVSKDVDAGDWIVTAEDDTKTVNVKKGKTAKLTYKNGQLN